MPTYDYECTRCATLFEAFHPMTSPAPGCPKCGAPPRRVFISAPAVHDGMARGREFAARSLPECGKGCSCCPK